MPSPDTDLLAARYGRTGTNKRLVVALVSALAVIGVGWVAWAGWVHSSEEVTAVVTSYAVTSDTTTEVTVRVDRSSGDAVECDVYAQAADHSRVGERVLRVPAGDAGQVVTTVTITTQREAVNGVVGECAAVG
jgi:hypothetical protein